MQFLEARENIDDAKDSEGSVYYAEDLDLAIESVQGEEIVSLYPPTTVTWQQLRRDPGCLHGTD